MGDVVERAELMFDLVGSPVPDPAGVQQVVVGDGTRPHQLRPDMIIVGAFESQRGVVDNRAHGGLQQPVGETT